MRASHLFASDWFYPILLLSVLSHLFFIFYVHSARRQPDFSVQQSISSIQVSIIHRKPPEEIKKKAEVLPIIHTQTEEQAPMLATEEIVEELIEKEVIQEEAKTINVSESQGAITEAKPLSHVNPAPRYPSIAQRRGWEGVVRLNVSVSSTGAVTNVVVQQGAGYSVLDRSAIKTVRQWRFEPAGSKAGPISSLIVIPIHFKLMNR